MNTRKASPWLALVVLTGVSTVGFIDRIVVNVLVEPVKAEFGLSDTQVSLMGMAFALMYIGVGVAAARLAERRRRLTLISLGTLVWSLATAACGLAGSWAQLLAARVGVGLGEAFGLPGNQSVLSDYFPASRRGLALSVLMLSPPIGAFVGFVGGGWIAQEFDWRTAFLIAAIPGLALSAIAYLFVEEPRRGQHDPGASDEVPPLSAVLRRLFLLPSARNLVIGSALAAMFGFGLNYFFTSLMIREFSLGLGEAGLYTGLIASLPAALSVLTCGWLGDRLGPKNPAAYALIPAVMMLIGGPAYAFAISRESLGLLLGLVCVATFFNFGYLGITFATIQNLMHPRMRATTVALLNVVYGIAGGLGPLTLGWMSDTFSVTQGPARGLATAMAVTGLAYLWASAHYFLAARKLPADMQAVRTPAAETAEA